MNQSEQISLRPWTLAELSGQIPFKVKSKKSGEVYTVTEAVQENNHVIVRLAHTGDIPFMNFELAEMFTLENGAPCGVLKRGEK